MPSKGGGSKGPMQRSTNSIDRAIAKQIKHYRTLANIDVSECAERIGIATQQLEAFERSKERVSAAHLVQLAAVFGVPVAAFFERPKVSPQEAVRDNVVPLAPSRKRRASTGALERRLVESFRTIESESDRQLVVDIAARLARACCSVSGR